MAPLSVTNTGLCVSFSLCSGTFGSKKICWKTVFSEHKCLYKDATLATCVRLFQFPAIFLTHFDEKVIFLFSRKCSDLNLPLDGAEQQKIGFKGILTLPKAIRFKSSLKDCCKVNVLKVYFRVFL